MTGLTRSGRLRGDDMLRILGLTTGGVLAGLFIGSFLAPGLPSTPFSSMPIVLSQIIEKNPTPPIESNPRPQIEQNPSPPIEQNPTPPIEQNPSPPIEKNPTPPIENQPTPPIKGSAVPSEGPSPLIASSPPSQYPVGNPRTHSG
jgi:hypothetical protein